MAKVKIKKKISNSYYKQLGGEPTTKSPVVTPAVTPAVTPMVVDPNTINPWNQVYNKMAAYSADLNSRLPQDKVAELTKRKRQIYKSVLPIKANLTPAQLDSTLNNKYMAVADSMGKAVPGFNIDVNKVYTPEMAADYWKTRAAYDKVKGNMGKNPNVTRGTIEPNAPNKELWGARNVMNSPMPTFVEREDNGKVITERMGYDINSKTFTKSPWKVRAGKLSLSKNARNSSALNDGLNKDLTVNPGFTNVAPTVEEELMKTNSPIRAGQATKALGGALQGGFSGAASGIAAGAAAGPPGMIIGGIAGGLLGAFGGSSAEDKEKKLRDAQLKQQKEEQAMVEANNKRIADTSNMQMYRGYNVESLYAMGGAINNSSVSPMNNIPISPDAQVLTTPSGRTDLQHGQVSNGEQGDIPIHGNEGNTQAIAEPGEVLAKDKEGNPVVMSKKLGLSQLYIILNERKKKYMSELTKPHSATELGTIKRNIEKVDFSLERLIDKQKMIGKQVDSNNGVPIAELGMGLPVDPIRDDITFSTMQRRGFKSFPISLSNPTKFTIPPIAPIRDTEFSFPSFDKKYNPSLGANNFKKVDVSWTTPELDAPSSLPIPTTPSAITKVGDFMNKNSSAIQSGLGLAGTVMGYINNNNRMDDLLKASQARKPYAVPYTASPTTYDNTADIASINSEYDKAIALAKAEGKDIRTMLPTLMAAKIEALSKTNQNKTNIERGMINENINRADQRIGTNMNIANTLQNDKLSNLAGYVAQRSAGDSMLLNNVLSYIKDGNLQNLDKDKLAILAQAYKVSGVMGRMSMDEWLKDIINKSNTKQP